MSIVLYHYKRSPYSTRIIWYLALRQIPYSQCLQPTILPRPDLKEKLGISYRRIPILAIGWDVYLDTRLIIKKLEEHYPSSNSYPPLSGTPDEHRGIEALLSLAVAGGDIFRSCAMLMPPQILEAQGQQFLRDRADLAGVKQSDIDKGFLPLSPEVLKAMRPQALIEVRQYVHMLETTFLGAGGNWLLKTTRPSLADLEAIWPIHWISTIPGALPPDFISKEQFPLVFGWLERFQQTIESQTQTVRTPPALNGDEAADMIVKAGFGEHELRVDPADPVVAAEGLKAGMDVEMWPTDWGSLHKDRGKLMGIDDTQFVIETRGTSGSVRVHAPRHGFKIAKAGDDGVKL